MTKIACKCGHPELKGIVHRENGGCYSIVKLREHELSIDCWCKPTRDEDEPSVILHNRVEH